MLSTFELHIEAGLPRIFEEDKFFFEKRLKTLQTLRDYNFVRNQIK